MHVDRFFDFPFVAASEGETFLYILDDPLVLIYLQAATAERYR